MEQTIHNRGVCKTHGLGVCVCVCVGGGGLSCRATGGTISYPVKHTAQQQVQWLKTALLMLDQSWDRAAYGFTTSLDGTLTNYQASYAKLFD